MVLFRPELRPVREEMSKVLSPVQIFIIVYLLKALKQLVIDDRHSVHNLHSLDSKLT